ncbi:cell adhesion molecule Dscam1-like isoform X2 [Tachypleus tridentatus]|uniref:cell adhesion molecule Dscam1-like isoform X2 n=1 Tax=Tachypleus tridentatus TaxID=6853 RepID=UPI003FD1ED4E
MFQVAKTLGFLIGLFIVISGHSVTSELVTRGPTFLDEPPDAVEFTNSSGAVIPCRADGQPVPSILWMTGNQKVAKHGRLQEISSDGSLVIKPFHPSDYRPDVHFTRYKCVVSNEFGVIRSKDVSVRAVIVRQFEVQVYNEYVIRGNSAVLKCHVPPHAQDLVEVTSWIQDENIHITSSTSRGGKYTVLAAGHLLVRDVTDEDERKVFRCQVFNRLTSESKISNKSGRLIITDVHSPISPRLIHSIPMIRGQQGDTLSLPCVAQGNPVPHYLWYRLHRRERVPLLFGHRVYQYSELLTLEFLSLADNGTYICVANNSAGEFETQTDVFVTAPFNVDLRPSVLTADFGDLVTFRCSVTPSRHPATTLMWFKNGQPLSTDVRINMIDEGNLNIHSVQRADKGMYQCMVTSEETTSQVSAQLVLREKPPTFHSTFEPRVVQPSSTISMKCSASGIPLPQITWTRDGAEVPEVYLTRIGDYVSNKNTVNSYVNISAISGSDGGFYTCTAENIIGRVAHSARLDVYGPPYIRPMGNRTVLAGRSTDIQCHFSGFPLKEVFWEKGGKKLPFNHRQQPFPNGTLVLLDVLHQDAGRYTCGATDGQGRNAEQELWITVATPPVIEPFKVPTDLSEGERASLMCVVSAGDLPISIKWMKDELPLPSNLEASVILANNYTSLLSFPVVRHKHRGNYTCVASNPVASDNFTALLDVKVPPKWKHRPVDQTTVLGHGIIFDCQAEGFPFSVARWKKAVGEKGEFRVVISNANTQILENGSLVIQEVHPEDAGSYMCQLTNGVGPGLSTVVDLSIHVPAHTEKNFIINTVKEGESITLECRARGENPIDITWTMNRVRFNPASNLRYIFKETEKPKGKVSTIIITSVSRSDSGLFVCSVENAFGKGETVFQVVVQENPDPPKDLRVKDKTSRSVSIVWTPPFNGNSPITKYLLEVKSTSDFWNEDRNIIAIEASRTQYTIQDLQPLSSYKIRMRTSNTLGVSDYSDIIMVITDEEPPGEKPREVTVSAAGSRSIKVVWKEPHQKDEQYNVLGYYIKYKILSKNEELQYKTVEIRDHLTHEWNIENLEPHSKYKVTVQAFNEKGSGPASDPVIVKTFEYDPPSSPHLRVLSTTTSTIHLTWDKSRDDNPVEAPQAPDKHSLFVVNVTSVTIHLSAWGRGGCLSLHFSVQYKPLESSEWILLSNNILPEQRSLTIPDLTPATWYTMLMTASNEAGNAEAEYVFATLTSSGATVPPHYSASSHTSGLYRQLKIIIPVVCTTVVLVLVVTIACVVLIRRRQGNPPNSTYSTVRRENYPRKAGETVPMAVWDKPNQSDPRLHHSREQLYFPSPYATSRLSVYSGEGETEGGGPPSDHRLRYSREHLPYPNPYGPSGTSVNSDELQTDRGISFSWGQLTSETGFHTYDIPVRRKQVSQGQSFRDEQCPSRVKNEVQHVLLYPGISSRLPKDLGNEFTDDLTTPEIYTSPKLMTSGIPMERHYDQIQRPKYQLSRSLQKKFPNGRTNKTDQRQTVTGEEMFDISDAECDRNWSRGYHVQES